MRLICLCIGTLLVILYIIKSISGKKYDEYIDALEGDEYPLKEIYGVGLSWQNGRLFALKGKMRETLIGQAKLLYEPKFAEFYATVTWAQAVSMIHLSLAVGFLLAGFADFVLFAFVGIGGAVLFGRTFLERMKSSLKRRETDSVIELPEIVSTMALLINSGMVLSKAWETVAYSKEGEIYTLMQGAHMDMQNGKSEIDAIYKFGLLSNSGEIRKFASAMIQGIEKGSRDLSDFLSKQSSEMWNLKKQLMLQKGEAAASKLVAPTAIMFLGIIVVVVAGAIGMLA